MKDNGFNVLLLIFYNQVIGLSAGEAGLVVGLALVVDAFVDAFVGYSSDHLHSRWGRRHPFMYCAALPVALSYLLLWNPPSGAGHALLLAYLFAVAVLVRSCISLYEIPSAALGPELTTDYDERTSYMSYRYLFGWVGGVSMYVLAFAVFLKPSATHPVAQLNPEGYHRYALVAAIVMGVTILISAAGTHRAIPTLRSPPPRRRGPASTAVRETLQTLSNPSAVSLLGGGGFAYLASGMTFALTTYFNTYFWELSPKAISVLGFSSYISAVIAMVAAPALAKRFGKKQAAIAVASLYGVLAPSAQILRLLGLFPANGHPALLPTLFFVGVLVVALSIIPPILVSSMMSDVVDDSEVRTGRRSEGVLFAGNAFLLKCVSGLGLLGAGATLSAARFPNDAQPGRVAPETLGHLALIYTLAVVVLNLLSVICLLRYRISREQHLSNLRALEVTDGPPQTASAETIAS